MRALPLVGEEFAGYRLRAVLGRGGMSTVFRAENPRLGNVIALKVMAPELAGDNVFRARFLEESSIAAGLNHPNVIPINDSGSSGGLLYIAMRYVTGTDLRQMIAKRGRLPAETATYLLGQAARAVDAAHRRGLVHRDVKPGNLLVEQSSDDADPDHLYLTDFGITRYATERTGLTPTGQFMGTVDYIAPEQVRGLTVTGLADQYSLGCVLYECLTGRVPFERDLDAAIIWAHVEELPPAPTMIRPDLPPALDEVFARVLAKDPGGRYASCREFMAAAREALGPLAEPPGGGGRPSAGAAARDGRFPALVLSGPRDYPGEAGYQAAVQSPGDPDSLTGPAAPARGDRGGWGWGPVLAAPVSAPASVSAPPPGGGRGPRDRGRPAFWPVITTAAVVLLLAAGALLGVKLAGGSQPEQLSSAGNQTVPTVGTSMTASPTSSAAAAPASPAGRADMGTRVNDGQSGPATLAGTLEAADNSREGHGLLPAASCGNYHQNASGQILCAAPVPGVSSIYYQNYATLTALYSAYQSQVSLLDGGKAFRPNTGTCGDRAVPYAEFGWNMEEGHPHNFTVAQLAASQVPQIYAGGRMACFTVQTAHGVMEDIVWTIDNGPALGVASGSPEAVYELWAALHHTVIFRDTEMCGTDRRMNMADIPTGNLRVFPVCPASVERFSP